MKNRLKILILAFVIILLITSMSVLLTSCNTPKYYATLEQAYADGKISRQDLLSIVYYWTSGTRDFGEDFVPTPKNPEELDSKTKEKIADAFLKEKGLIGYAEIGVKYKDLIHRIVYLGTYNELIVCVVDAHLPNHSTKHNFTIDGTKIDSYEDWYFIVIQL